MPKKQKGCQKCGALENLHINSRTISAIQYMCRECQRNRQIKYRKTEKGKKAVREAVKRSTQKFKIKQDARVYLNLCVNKGLVLKPENCSRCENKKVEAHHSDYSKPLEVLWLCRGCHADLHKTGV